MANEVTDLLLTKHTDPIVRQKLHNIGDIVAAACLCHDLGNPPFGHSGEKTISSFFSEGGGLALRDELTERQWNDFTQLSPKVAHNSALVRILYTADGIGYAAFVTKDEGSIEFYRIGKEADVLPE